ncbi:DMT family transporter [Tropicibacter naphthalenivorans]|uniref:Putative DMT superfamily transporter inner membrane protein n=1 Tax=Tropicibacter naphthalenivorans TaxID=441103 RepID=A0A0P1G6L8_9RHOB|nr:DMT family transporter [Tropicibacter naphthalenivorans]CUH77285.1 putative DMT superfamily transporter inner membrane protein [Tropicibacter naphthalenivorans]SMC59232.1 Permease of the drug/metabolite transporter (DMT) superfamily [Tropicibacter naphthalenivorans]
MTQTSISTRAWAELILLGVIWGGSFLATRTALDEVGPLTTVLWRTGLAAAILWPIVWAKGMRAPRGGRIWGALLVMGLLNNALPFSLLAWGQQYIASSLTSILNGTTAIFGVIIAALVFADERLTARKSLGVLIGFAGVITAIGPAALMEFDIRSTAQLAVLGATFCYGLSGAWARATLRGLAPLEAAAGMLTCSAVLMIGPTLAVEGLPSVSLSASTWAGLIYVSAISTSFAYLVYYRVLAMAGAGNLMLVTLMTPPVAIVLGAYVRDEALLPSAYLGLALLAVGLLIIDGRLLRKRAI